jgi:hypothetical protein
MRSSSTLALATLTLVALAAAPPFATGAIAAGAHAKRQRVAHSTCSAIHASKADVVAALLSQSMTGGPLYVNGQRVCVDTAHPFYQWSDGSTSPAPPQGRGWRPAPAF